VKILIAIQYYLPHRTGVPIHVQRVSEELIKRGHQVTILTARHLPELKNDEVLDGMRIVRLRGPIRISRGMVTPAYPYAAWRLLRQHDVVWMQTPMLETALMGILTRIMGKNLVATHHGDLILPEGMFNRFVRWFTFQNYRIMAKLAARLIAYSHDYADHSYYLQPYHDKVSVIFPPIHVPDPQPQEAERLRAEWQLNGGPVIGYAGRFVEEKRPDLLIKALETINKTYPNARIVFAGEYDIKYEDTWENNQDLIAKYKNQLVFLGQLTSMQAMSNFFAACDVLAMPSDTECFALVQVEAMMCGTPVIMTDTPGGRVPVTETGMGKIVPVGNAQALGEAIVEVVSHRDQYVKSRTEIEQIFNFQQTVDRYERHFRQAAERNRRK
jgi:glycosyltransferase involved in cell wall biosynthesis